jgi:hypothetical protein
MNTKSGEVRLAGNARGNTQFTTKITGNYNIYDTITSQLYTHNNALLMTIN